jgi:hypothetical protein
MPGSSTSSSRRVTVLAAGRSVPNGSIAAIVPPRTPMVTGRSPVGVLARRAWNTRSY